MAVLCGGFCTLCGLSGCACPGVAEANFESFVFLKLFIKMLFFRAEQ